MGRYGRRIASGRTKAPLFGVPFYCAGQPPATGGPGCVPAGRCGLVAVVGGCDAARGLVAETFIATSTSGARYFVKITHMPFFKCRIPTSMPGHAALAQLLPDAVSHPVATCTGQWHVALADAMVTVCDFVDAPLYETYDTAHFGRLIGRIHNSTPAIAIHLPRVQFFAIMPNSNTCSTWPLTVTTLPPGKPP